MLRCAFSFFVLFKFRCVVDKLFHLLMDSEVIDSVRFLIIVYLAVSLVSLVSQSAGLRVLDLWSHWFIRWFASFLTKLSP